MNQKGTAYILCTSIYLSVCAYEREGELFVFTLLSCSYSSHGVVTFSLIMSVCVYVCCSDACHVALPTDIVFTSRKNVFLVNYFYT